MRFKPHDYQAKAESHILDNPEVGLFLDMGLGKTAITLSACAKLIDRLESRGALIVAPLRVTQLVWPQEVRKWDHTRSLRVSSVTGERAKREAALSANADLYLINYDNLLWLCDWLDDQDPARLPFDTLVFDESSKMKAPDAKRFKAIKRHLGSFKRRILLTGTPTPQSYEDLWSQMYILDKGKRLGQFVTHFRSQHFRDLDPYGYSRVIRPNHAKIIEDRIQDIVLCLKAEDHLDMPKLIVNEVEVELPAKVRDLYDQLEDEMFIRLESLAEVEAMNRAVLMGKCRQFVGGAVYDSSEDPTPPPNPTWSEIHSAKFDALEEVIEGSSGQPLLVAYEFKHELARLLKRWPGTPWIGGGSKGSEKLVEKWNRGEVQMMFVHPASVGHGINLQYGGHILVWLTLPWSLELYEQTVKRLHRQGQSKPVIVHILKCLKTVDVAVSKAIASKAQGQAGLFAALKAYRQTSH